ncbi:MAG: cell division protein ZapA [Rickettsiales bacterium]|nr:cell division protein ZapA [Rickettsiales bacterium]
MAVVDITIGKRTFQLMCGEGQELHLQRLAEEVSERVEELAGSIDTKNDTLLLVMASLMLQDELNELRAGGAANSNDSDDTLIEALDAISDYVDGIAERIESR